MHLRIAILECDTVLPKTRSKYGRYGGLFTTLLKAGAKHINLDEELQITAWDVVEKQEYPDLEDVDAVLMTGSKHSAYLDTPWITRLVDFAQKVLAQDRVKIIGICFGHQIVGRAMGVKVGKSDRGWEVSVMDMELTEKGKELFGKEKLVIHQMHKDIVYEYPPGAESLGFTPKCEIHGMLVPRRVITIQGHPEFDKDIMTELLETRHTQGIFDDPTYEDGMARVAREQDGVMVYGVFLRFLQDKL